MANELDGIKRLLRASPEDPNIIQEQDWDGLVAAIQGALDQKAPRFGTRLDIAAPALSASLRDDGSGNLGIYVGAAGAADNAQIKVATVEKATGAIASTRKVTLGSTSGVVGNFPDFRLLTTDDRGWRVGSASTGTTHDYFYIQGTIDGFVSSFITGLSIAPSGNVGIGTIVPGDKLTVVGAGNTYVLTSNGTVSLLSGVSAGSVGVVGTTSAHDLQIYSKGAARLFVGDTGTFAAGFIAPSVDNSYTMGGPSSRWTTIYAVTGSINTSDATMKALRDGALIGRSFNVSPLESAEIAAAKDIAKEIGVFKWQDAIAEKGDAARLHIGLTVQRAVEIMEGHGLDPWAYGFMCRDEITRKVKVMRTVTEQKTEAAEPVLVIEMIDGVPTQVLREQPDRPVFDMRPVIGIDGAPVVIDGEPLLHPVPVMIEVDREIEIEEPAGERLGFRPDQLALFILAGTVGG